MARLVPFSFPAGVTVDTQNLEMLYSVSKGPRENKQDKWNLDKHNCFVMIGVLKVFFLNFVLEQRVCWLHHLFHFLFWYHYPPVLFLTVSFS